MKFKLVIGLGNPGERYRETYHNVGFLAVDALLEKRGGYPVWKSSRNSLFTYAQAKGDSRIFVKPSTFMNASGKAVEEAIHLFKTSLSDIVVIHDESDLPLGTIRIATASGSAGHRGIASIIHDLGSKAFFRIRIGIHPNEPARKPASAFVLKRIAPADQETLQLVFDEVGAALEKLTENEHR